MRTEPSTPKIVRAFDAAAETYDAAAQVQREIARDLVFRAAASQAKPPRTILDLGCGPGAITEFARKIWPEAEFCALDAAPTMLATLRRKFPQVTTICADAGRLNGSLGRIGRYDLILSSMMLHWLDDPGAALSLWRDVLTPGGRLVVALPVAGSLLEWRDICRAEDFPDPLWDFPPPDFAAGLCDSAEERIFYGRYASLAEFLQSLKKTGAHLSRPERRAEKPAALRRLLAKYNEPFVATFRIAFLTLAAKR